MQRGGGSFEPTEPPLRTGLQMSSMFTTSRITMLSEQGYGWLQGLDKDPCSPIGGHVNWTI